MGGLGSLEVWVPALVQIGIGVLTLVALTIKLGERQRYLETRLNSVVEGLHDDCVGYMSRAEIKAELRAIHDKIDRLRSPNI